MAHDTHTFPQWLRFVWTAELRIEVAREGRCTVCSLAGDLHADNAQLVRQVLDEALDRRPRVLAVDLSAVELFTAGGLDVLLQAHSHALARGGAVALVAPSQGVHRVLELTGADTVLTVYPTLAQALDSAGPPGQGAAE
jgi:anti-anti-sigma factor